MQIIFAPIYRCKKEIDCSHKLNNKFDYSDERGENREN